MKTKNDTAFEDVLQGLRNGDFSRLDPLFRSEGDATPRVVQWIEEGCFAGHDQELSEALTCAAEPKLLSTC